MKHSIYYLLAFTLVFLSCKKGDGDPDFSFRTRKARLAGKWTVKTASVSFTQDNVNRSYIINGNDLKSYSTYQGGGYVTYYYGRYSLVVTIDKDGGFSVAETLPGYAYDYTGQWSFNSGTDKYEKKEQVFFVIEDAKKGRVTNSFFGQLGVTFLYTIETLKNKDLHLMAAGLYKDDDNLPIKYTMDFTLVQK